MLGVDVIATSHMMSIFNMADVNVQLCDSLMATSTLKLNTGDKGMQEKESILVAWCR